MGRWPSRYVTGTPESVVYDALIGACFAECRAVRAAEHEAAGKERDTYFAALDTLVVEIDRFRVALEFYADYANYDADDDHVPFIEDDRGETARRALYPVEGAK